MAKDNHIITKDEYKRYTNKHWLKLNECVKQYSKNSNDLDKDDLQQLRDDISMARYFLSDYYADTRTAAEAADYHRKQAVSAYMLKKPAKGVSVSQWENEARVNTKEEEDAMMEANKKFYRIKLVMETSHHILNSISSRLNNFEKEA